VSLLKKYFKAYGTSSTAQESIKKDLQMKVKNLQLGKACYRKMLAMVMLFKLNLMIREFLSMPKIFSQKLYSHLTQWKLLLKKLAT